MQAACEKIIKTVKKNEWQRSGYSPAHMRSSCLWGKLLQCVYLYVKLLLRVHLSVKTASTCQLTHDACPLVWNSCYVSAWVKVLLRVRLSVSPTTCPLEWKSYYVSTWVKVLLRVRLCESPVTCLLVCETSVAYLRVWKAAAHACTVDYSELLLTQILWF